MAQVEDLFVIGRLVPVLLLAQPCLKARHEVDRAYIGAQVEEAAVKVEVLVQLREPAWAKQPCRGALCACASVPVFMQLQSPNMVPLQ